MELSEEFAGTVTRVASQVVWHCQDFFLSGKIGPDDSCTQGLVTLRMFLADSDTILKNAWNVTFDAHGWQLKVPIDAPVPDNFPKMSEDDFGRPGLSYNVNIEFQAKDKMEYEALSACEAWLNQNQTIGFIWRLEIEESSRPINIIKSFFQ